MEGEAQNAHEEVNGIAGEVTFGPAPITVFDDQTGVGGQDKIARLLFDELESALLQQGNQRDLAGGADLFAWKKGSKRGQSQTLIQSLRPGRVPGSSAGSWRR